MNTTKISKKIWAPILLFGLFGQLAWVVENMYFNVFLYNTITDDPNAIATMVAASAITATVTTLLMGALSDKLGKRKIFITMGYIIWGLSTMAFSLISVENTQKLFPVANAVAMTTALVVIMDCVMTFFGSTANDSAFNAWVTDITDKTNRGRVETVLSAMPLIAMLVVFGGLDGLTKGGNWKLFYTIVGGLVTIGGVIGMFLIKDTSQLKINKENYFKNIFYGFRISTIKSNKNLYMTYLTYAILYIAYNIFMPYIIIYLQRTLMIENYAIPLGIILILSALLSVLLGGVMDKVGKHKFMLPSVLVLIVGFVLMYFVKGDQMVFLIVGATIMMSANLLLTSSLNGTIRDYTPDGKVGLFQGIRMIFAVLVPMVIGPFIGAAVIKSSNETYIDLGVVKQVPTHNIFIACAVVSVIAVLPVLYLYREGQKQITDNLENK